MKNSVRYAIFAIFMIAVLVLAEYGTVWANTRADAPRLGWSSHASAPEAGQGKGGTVKPPPHHIYITKPGTYSVGGCLIHVENLAPGVTLSVEFISRFHNGRKLDDDHPRFRAGTCRIQYYKNGKPVDEIKDPEEGSVKACFAARRDPQGIVHEWSPKTRKWSHQPTTYEVYDPRTGQWRPAQGNEPALTCGKANKSGYYLVSSK